MSEDACGLVTKTDVRGRGWSERMIDTFLGAPDQVKRNPHYRSAAPMQLYQESRVRAAEQTPQFQEIQQKRIRRREGARKGASTKRKMTQAFVKTVEITVPKFAPDELIGRACHNYNAFKSSFGREYDPAHPSSDAAFIERISVNFLRHCMTKYESVLGHTTGKVGAAAAYREIKHRALDAIATAYPHLSAECRRQKKSVNRSH